MKTHGFRRILWPTDFSPGSMTVLPRLIDLAADGASEVVVLHVLPPLPTFSLPEGASVWERWDESSRSHAAKEMAKLIDQLRKAKVRTKSLVVTGVPFDQILRAAKRLKCDLIVLATHGRTGLKHLFMGSTAERVIRHVHCPVLVVR